jgi:hypothetical protein
MTREEAIATLEAYKQGKAGLVEALHTLDDLGIPKTEMARLSGVGIYGIWRYFRLHPNSKK